MLCSSLPDRLKPKKDRATQNTYQFWHTKHVWGSCWITVLITVPPVQSMCSRHRRYCGRSWTITTNPGGVKSQVVLDPLQKTGLDNSGNDRKNMRACSECIKLQSEPLLFCRGSLGLLRDRLWLGVSLCGRGRGRLGRGLRLDGLGAH